MYSDWKNLPLGNGQMWNQLPSGGMMTDKSRLHKLLVLIKATQYQPETYILTDAVECVKFFSGPGKNSSMVWVTKEPLSAEGQGIIVNPDIDLLRQLWLKDPEASDDKIVCKSNVTTDSVLIQQYVLNPLLLNGKKMEIRTYWLIASVDPFIVLYRDGTVRLTTRDYKTEEWSDPLIHITNVRQQKKADPNYHLTESERKWSLEQLADYLVEQKKVTLAPEVWLNQLRVTLKEIIGRVARGAYPQLRQLKGEFKAWDGRFELFGMDVILDDNLRPWLTEIQDGPGLSLDPGTKRKVIPEMLEELTDIILEVDRGHRFNNHQIPLPLRSLGKWQLVNTDF
jgi:hypothetical protein